MTQDPKTTDIPPSEGAYTPPEQRSSRTAEFFSDLWTLKGPLMVVISVAGTLPLLLLVEGTEAKCAYVLIVMAILWLTEAIPIPVTSLFPVFMFPLVGVLPAADTANSYMGKTSLLFIGGLLVAIAVEETNLHRRLALSVLKIVGSDPKWLMLGLMAPTWFLSMWISNTATSSMMVPIVEAILDQLKGTNKDSDASLDQLADDINKSLDAGKRKKKISYELADTTDTKKRIREYGVYRQNSEKSWDGSVDSDNTIQHILHETGLSVPRNKEEKKANGDVSETQVDIDLDQDSQSSATRRDSASSDTASATGTLTNGKSDVTFSNNNDTFNHTNHSSDNSGKKVTIIDNNDKKKKDDGSEDEEFKRLCKAFSLSIAYAANTGGIATLTGTPPNLVFNGQAARLYEKYNADPEVTFLKWMSMAFPLALLLLVLAWLWLGIFFLRLRFLKHDVSRKRVVQKIIMTEYTKIGPISFAEVSTLVLFVILALLWLSRKPEFVDGWSELFLDSYVDDSTCAVLIGCLFFILPAKMPNVFCWRDKNAKPSYTPLLTWKVAQRKMPWGIIVLLGGGFAVAKGCTTSGLSDWLGKQLASFDTLDPWVLNLVISIIVAMATEVTSNTATATLLMPVTFELAVRLQVNPLYLMASTALATSFAFMMPVATPPNAIVFSHGRLSIPDMRRKMNSTMAVKSNHGTYLFVAILVIMMCTVHGRLVCRMVDFPNVARNLEDFPIRDAGLNQEDCKEACLAFSECMSTAFFNDGITFIGCLISLERVDVQPPTGTGNITVSLKECMEISTLPPTTLPPTTDIMSTTDQASTTEKNVYPGYGYGYGYRSFQSRLLNFLLRYRGGK